MTDELRQAMLENTERDLAEAKNGPFPAPDAAAMAELNPTPLDAAAEQPEPLAIAFDAVVLLTPYDSQAEPWCQKNYGKSLYEVENLKSCPVRVRYNVLHGLGDFKRILFVDFTQGSATPAMSPELFKFMSSRLRDGSGSKCILSSERLTTSAPQTNPVVDAAMSIMDSLRRSSEYTRDPNCTWTLSEATAEGATEPSTTMEAMRKELETFKSELRKSVKAENDAGVEIVHFRRALVAIGRALSKDGEEGREYEIGMQQGVDRIVALKHQLEQQEVWLASYRGAFDEMDAEPKSYDTLVALEEAVRSDMRAGFSGKDTIAGYAEHIKLREGERWLARHSIKWNVCGTPKYGTLVDYKLESTTTESTVITTSHPEPEDQPTRIMLDIETLGTTPGCVVLSIGAVKIERGEETARFYEVISLKDSTDHGLVIETETMVWWMDQPEDARGSWMRALSISTLKDALTAFNRWVFGTNDESRWHPSREVEFWCKGAAFDFPILEAAYRAVKMTPPWHYSMLRCYRTLAAQSRVDPPEFEGTPHDALCDARHQARHLISILEQK